MAAVKDIGIVVRRLDYSETSQIIAALCRETGLQRLIAKGIKRGTKKRVATGIDLLELGSVVYSRRSGSEAQLGTLMDWRQEELFPGIRGNLASWYAAQYAAERTAQMTEEGDPHVQTFDALRGLLMNIRPERALGDLSAYLLVLLREVGLIPQWGRCVGCGQEPAAREAVYFSSRQGGILCRDCEPSYVEKRRVDPAGLALLREAAEGAAVRGERKAEAAAFDLLDYHLTETLGKPSRLADGLRQAAMDA